MAGNEAIKDFVQIDVGLHVDCTQHTVCRSCSDNTMLTWIGIPRSSSLPLLDIIQSSSSLLGIVLKK